MRRLKFPAYEYIKSLPTKCKDSDMFHEYDWTLFCTPTSVYGRFSYNEDDSGWIFFDVMEDGYCDHNNLGMRCKFNKKNYIKICQYAQKVYEEFYKALDYDCSQYWEKYQEENNEI